MEKVGVTEIESLNKSYLQNLSDSEPDLVLSWLSGLTELEQIIVSCLFQINKALSIKQIRSNIIFMSLRNVEDHYKTNQNNSFPFRSFYLTGKDKREEIKSLQNVEERWNKLVKTIKFPSFQRIDNTLKTLTSLRIIFTRGTEDKKIKSLYFLNPMIRTKLNSLKEKK